MGFDESESTLCQDIAYNGSGTINIENGEYDLVPITTYHQIHIVGNTTSFDTNFITKLRYICHAGDVFTNIHFHNVA